MKKKLGKKFALKRETLRDLSGPEVENAAGAAKLTYAPRTYCNCGSISDVTCICATNATDWTCTC